MNLSVVIPLHNEEGNVARLLGTVRDSLARNRYVEAFEVVCVNDGSTDGTAGLLEQHRADWLRIVTLPHRCGQSVALAAGLFAARHEVLARIDGDLQTTPDDFEAMLPLLERGVDCVHGVRARRHDSLARRWSSVVANAVRRAVLRDGFRDISCPLTVFRRACATALVQFDAMHRYLPLLIAARAYLVVEVPVRHFPRSAGTTKYGVVDRIGVGLRSLLVVRRLIRAAPRYWRTPSRLL